ncbi:unnamed protein product, partial [Allacma fusca]
KALPFALSKASYDIWVANNRACEGTRHKNLTQSDFKYWDFRKSPMKYIARYDVPAVIDHVLNTTNSPALDYVAYSLVGLVVIMTLASRPDYNDKIRKMAVMGSACYSTSDSSTLSTPTGLVVASIV